jgi:hypothetical protein
MGTLGLAWAIRGVDPNQRWTVVALLSTGILAFVWRLSIPMVDWISSEPVTWPSRLSELFNLLLIAWFLLGPISIGTFHLVKLVRASLQSPDKSLERTHER